jgi:hypothetical protein
MVASFDRPDHDSTEHQGWTERPVRILVYEDAATKTGQVEYDFPPSLMARLKNEQITAAAKLLDGKLAALAKHCTGTSG